VDVVFVHDAESDAGAAGELDQEESVRGGGATGGADGGGGGGGGGGAPRGKKRILQKTKAGPCIYYSA